MESRNVLSRLPISQYMAVHEGEYFKPVASDPIHGKTAWEFEGFQPVPKRQVMEPHWNHEKCNFP